MITELQKRPFVRPLLIWITGILLQANYSYGVFSVAFLFFPSLAVFYFYIGRRKPNILYNYEARWLWGALFLSLLLFLSIQKTAYSQRRQYELPEVSRMQQIAARAQHRLLESFDALNLTDNEKSVLATITLGYRQAMDREVKKQFSVTGVAHLLSVSGFHVAIVCGFLSLFLSSLPRRGVYRWIHYLLNVGLLWLFTYISGLAASAVRAALMLSLYLTGRLLRRRTDGYNTLAAAAFGMLVYEPLYLFDIGFQLSYIAVFFILYIQPGLSRLIPVRNPLLATPWSWITMTMAAQIGTTFLCLYYFSQFSTVFLFTNLPLTLLATLLIPAGLVWIVLPSGFPGYGLLQSVVEILTRSMLWVVEAFSRVPGAVFTFRFNFYALLLGYGILFFTFVYIRNRRPWLLLTALFLLLILLLQKLIERFMA